MIHKLIDTSTAAYPTGLPPQSRLFKVQIGPFAGRLVAFFARTPSVLSWSRSDPPYTTWTTPVDFVTDADDLPFGAMMDANADVFVAYTRQTSQALVSLKLAFANGTWVTQSPATVSESGASANSHPSLLRDLYDRIWVLWTRDESGALSIRVNSSIDNGQTFGTGPSDPGIDLSGAVVSCYGQIVARSTYLHSLFTADGVSLHHRQVHLDAALWDSIETLYTGTGLGPGFNASVSADETLGVLFAADDSLLLREYDGMIWRAVHTVADTPVNSPALIYIRTNPYTLFLKTIGAGQQLLHESHRVGGEFTSPAPVVPQLCPFASVLCYDADAGVAYAELTTEAASPDSADVIHSSSGVMLEDAGDAVYFGSDDRFSLLRCILSTAGEAGIVAWSYWNGSEWDVFTPVSGVFSFDSADVTVRLFPDGSSTPADWQKGIVSGVNRYWIRAVVTTPFTSAPIGSQLTPVAETSNLIPLRM